ncbi:hypothetical Protein YC6258_03635 [Gynuella sunshinyii YC6258]|uniref:Uncharacterized protein n=1 Tax=Gynuella sunshinyii YC6258 TaxID=1445510 RepID=A0A0C5VMY9_9GAMM|nr:hypothetical Protein YC6258_03635 [Gynuella sunshinyii YC6258]
MAVGLNGRADHGTNQAMICCLFCVHFCFVNNRRRREHDTIGGSDFELPYK